MKNLFKYIFGALAILVIIIACTKEVGLYTEVEFEISETHVAEGFINTPLATSITVTPEELVEGYSYSYSYKINTGEGYFQDEAGNTIAEGDKIGLSPLSASLNYIATKIGDHSITFTAEDTFGFQEQVTASYTISDVPVTWTATGPSGQVLIGSSQDITVTLGSETTATGVTYERNYSFTQGTGTITSSPSGANETLNQFVSITPGTFTLTYVSTELGQTTLEFLLKDSNGQEILQTVSFEVVDELSTEKEITSFIVNGVAGTIVGTGITVELPEGTDVTALAPVIIHTGASISPESETSQDFSNPIIYTVTAQDQTIQAYIVNCSSDVSVASVAISPNPIIISIGGTENLSAIILPANASNQNVTWSSSDDAIASVSATGVVTGNAIGTATITVATEDGDFTASSTITVQAATFAVTRITVDPSAITITNGSTTALTETIAPANATNKNVTWTSSDDAIASVSATGIVTGNATGEATITVTTEDGGFTATSTITVQAATFAVTGITVDPTAITITNGSTTTVTETIAPANATNQNVTWSSDNISVATVNTSGVVTSVGIGEAKITVTTEDGGFTATSLVTVEAASIAVTGVSISPTSITITNGNTTILNETVLPTNATNQTVTWSSSNTSVATVSASGEVTAIGVGSAVITVTTEEDDRTATSLIIVEAAPIEVTGVEVLPLVSTITVGGTTTLNETVLPTNADNQNVTWSSDNTNVATVSVSGEVTGVAAGSATITVRTLDGNKSATAIIKVEAVPIDVIGVTLKQPTLAFVVGDIFQALAIINPLDATNNLLLWSSSNTSVATIDANGEVTAISNGSTTITVTTFDGGFTDTITITVKSIVDFNNGSTVSNSNSSISGILTITGDSVVFLISAFANGSVNGLGSDVTLSIENEGSWNAFASVGTSTFNVSSPIPPGTYNYTIQGIFELVTGSGTVSVVE